MVRLERPAERRLSTLSLLGLEQRAPEVRAELGDGPSLVRALREHGVSDVFHLGAESIVGAVAESPLGAFETNVRGTWTLLDACLEAGSSGSWSPPRTRPTARTPSFPYREEYALQPTTAYEASKAAADIIARTYAPAYGLAVAVTRFANTYGGGDLHFSRIIPEAVCAAIDGRAPVLRSDGSPERDFLYVEDAADAYIAIAARPRPRRRPRRGVQRRRPAAVPGRRRGRAGSPSSPAPGSSPRCAARASPRARSTASSSTATKIRERCGWKPEVDLDEGLRRTIEWYRAHPEARPSA